MKQQLPYFFICAFILGTFSINAQNLEDFEGDPISSTSFGVNGQVFNIVTLEAGPPVYDVEVFANGGWNGTGVDDQFIDNSTGTATQGNGSSFSIVTNDGTDITVKSFYLFVSNRSLSGPGTPTTLTIEGRKDGGNVFTVTKTSGIVDGSTFTPNNGFTFIDLSSEGGSDNSNENIDELIISSTNNADYLALDAFVWDAEVLSTQEFEMASLKVFPNPTSNYITISGLKGESSYIIYNVLGREISSGIVNNMETITVNSFSNGLYFLKFENGNTFKFTKE